MHLRIFDWQGTQITKEAFPDDDLRQSIIRETYLNKTTHEIGNASAGEKTRYLFINMADLDCASDMSLIAELTYSTTAAQTELADMLGRHSINLLIAIACIMLLSVGAAHNLTKPIRMLVRDVDAIARGDLDHRICVAGGEEFVRLEQSVTAMVAAMRETIRKLRESEEAIIRYSHILEEEVRERSVELQESNRIANLYLDIMTHDINNANNAANLYADLLLQGLEGKQEEYASKAKMGLQKSIETINNVNTIRQIQEREPHLKEVDLDQVIRKEVVRFTGSPITYTNTGATVLADDLISEIFVNLIGNAAKFGGPEVEVAIRVEEHGDEVCVSVEDTGPGMSGITKTQVFNRLRKGEGAMSGKGLGLYICRMLIERYGGRIWAEDRVPGTPELGAAIRFTLKRVPGSDPPSPDKPPE